MVSNSDFRDSHSQGGQNHTAESDSGSRPEEYREVEKAFKFDEGDLKQLFDELLIPRIRNNSLAENLNRYQYRDRLNKAVEIVDDLRFAFTRYLKNASRSMFVPRLDLKAIDEKPDEWKAPSPIDTESLDFAASCYLKEPWMQLDRIDWYILNGLIFGQMASLSNALRSRKTTFWRIGLTVATFCLRWFVLPAVAALLYYLGYLDAAKWVLGAYGVYIAYYLVLFPWRYSVRRRLKKEYADIKQRLKASIQIYQSVSATTINPTHVKEQIAQLEKGKSFFKPAVYAILDRAITRDPAALVLE